MTKYLEMKLVGEGNEEIVNRELVISNDYPKTLETAQREKRGIMVKKYNYLIPAKTGQNELRLGNPLELFMESEKDTYYQEIDKKLKEAGL